MGDENKPASSDNKEPIKLSPLDQLRGLSTKSDNTRPLKFTEEKTRSIHANRDDAPKKNKP